MIFLHNLLLKNTFLQKLIMRSLLFSILFALQWVYGTDCAKAESQLYKDLMVNYSKLVRPVINDSDALRVEMKVFLQQILAVDGKNQIIELNAWLKFIWVDYRLAWNPDKYEGIKSIRFAGGDNQIWRPDILLYNSANEDFDATFKSNEVVYNTGEVNWVPPGIFRASCKMDITYFPFDDQICFLKFSSWTYNGFALDLRIHTPDDEAPQMDLSTYVASGEWDLVRAPAVREVTYNTCCPEPYPTVTFFMHLRRRTVYYLFNVVSPSLLISLMTLMGFCLPATDMSEKIGYQMTILLSICFFVTVVSEMTPPTSEAVPLLGLFFSVLTFILSVSVCFTVNVLNLRYRQALNHKMNPVFYKVFLVWLPWLLLMKRPGVLFQKGKERRDNEYDAFECEDVVDTVYPCCCTHDDSVLPLETLEPSPISYNGGMIRPLLTKMYSMPAEHLHLERKVGDGIFPKPVTLFRRTQSQKARRVTQFEKYIRKCREMAADPESPNYCEYTLAVVDYYTHIHNKMTMVRKRVTKLRNIKIRENEWRFAAMALDRLCLILFTIFITICLFAMGFSTSRPGFRI